MLEEWIAQAEERWLPSLNGYLLTAFSSTFLPSHDHLHHLRVWKQSVRLLTVLDKLGTGVDYNLVEGCLVASMFHDVGLVRESGEMHGPCGSDMCKEFFAEGNLEKPAAYREILKAISFHDTKSRDVYAVFERGKTPGILNILSVADDLEALGIIGIYRYSEIYLQRGVALEKLGLQVQTNAFRRRSNLLNCCRHLPVFSSEIQDQHALLSDFFNLYNQQVLVVERPEKCSVGELGIINRLLQGMEEHIRPEEWADRLDPETAGLTVSSYFNELEEILKQGD